MPVLEAGAKAPNISLSTNDGRQISLDGNTRTTPVVAAFFKVGCPTCQYAFPYLERIYKAYPKDKVSFVGVSQDSKEDTAAFTVPLELASCLNPPSNGQASSTKMKVGDRAIEIIYVGKVSDSEILLRLALVEAAADKSALRRAFALTDRETDVLLWIAAGKSNRDIAEILGLSPRTVNKYLDQIYLKISVENRASAAAKAVRVLTGL